MPFVQNPSTREIRIVDDPSTLLAQGWHTPTSEEVDQQAKEVDFGTFGEQAQAQGERVVRGATLGAVPGFGAPEDIQARADVSKKLSPATSFAADVAPMVGIGALAAATGGAAAVGLGAAEGGLAAGTAALGAESAATGLVGAGQAAFERHQYLGEDPGRDAENALIFGGLNFGLGMATKALTGALGKEAAISRFAAEGEQTAASGAEKLSVEDVVKAAEADAARQAPSVGQNAAEIGQQEIPVGAEEAGPEEVALPEGVEGETGAEGRPLTSAEIKDQLGSQFAQLTGLPRAEGDVELGTNLGTEVQQGAAPLRGEVRLLDREGDLVPLAPDDPQLASVAPEIQSFADTGISGKSLDDLRALPLDANERGTIDALKQDQHFLDNGNVKDNFGSERGGLPALTIEPDGVFLSNGRHRLTAAREAGLDEITFHVKSYDADGNTLWDYVGPVRISEKAPAEVGGGAASAAAARQAEHAAVDDGMDRALANASRSDAQDVVEQATAEGVPAREESSLGRQRRLYQNRGAILDISTRELADNLRSAAKDLPEIISSGKVADLSRSVGDNVTSQRVVADGIAENAASLAGTLRGEAKAYGASLGKERLQYAVAGSKQLVATLTDSARALADADTGPAMWDAAHAFDLALQGHRSELAGTALAPRIEQLASNVRTALEDSGVWGAAGDAQKAYNAVVRDQLAPALGKFGETLGSDAAPEKFLSGKLEPRLRGLLESNSVSATQDAHAALDALDSLAGLQAQHGDAAAGQRVAASVAKARRTLDLAGEVQDASSRMQAAGQMAGHVPLVGKLAKEWVTGDLANAFRRLSGGVDRAVDRGVDDWIESSVVRGQSGTLIGKAAGFVRRSVTGSGYDSAVADIARRQSISHGLARFMGQDQTPLSAFERARAALSSDEQFFKAMGQDYKSLQTLAPETYLMLAGRATIARQFLLDRMPANVSVSMLRPNGYPPSRDAIEDWSVLWNAVKDPLYVVGNLRSARIQELQAVEAVYPRLYERTLQRVIQQIGDAQTAGKPLDDALLMRLGVLFPIDGVASPAFSRAAVQLAASYQVQQPAGMGAPPSKQSQRSLAPDPVQGVAQNGATFGSGF